MYLVYSNNGSSSPRHFLCLSDMHLLGGLSWYAPANQPAPHIKRSIKSFKSDSASHKSARHAIEQSKIASCSFAENHPSIKQAFSLAILAKRKTNFSANSLFCAFKILASLTCTTKDLLKMKNCAFSLSPLPAGRQNIIFASISIVAFNVYHETFRRKVKNIFNLQSFVSASIIT